MKKQIDSLVKKAMWVVVVLFVIRCAVSFEEIKTNPTVYSFFGYAGEAVGVAAILMVLYEKWLWRWDPLAGIPCIKGNYEGSITSTFDSTKRDASLAVKQSYLSVGITMSTSESESRSITASIESVSGVNRLVFSYQNDPKAEVRDRSQIHYGSAMFTLAEKDHLQGTYFTDRKTTGDLDFIKVDGT